LWQQEIEPELQIYSAEDLAAVLWVENRQIQLNQNALDELPLQSGIVCQMGVLFLSLPREKEFQFVLVVQVPGQQVEFHPLDLPAAPSLERLAALMVTQVVMWLYLYAAGEQVELWLNGLCRRERAVPMDVP
jgi:hypothetical protein